MKKITAEKLDQFLYADKEKTDTLKQPDKVTPFTVRSFAAFGFNSPFGKTDDDVNSRERSKAIDRICDKLAANGDLVVDDADFEILKTKLENLSKIQIRVVFDLIVDVIDTAESC